jgi:crotonobetainyl-CoA:carnitine CoA-transferase CaiB-like acyl-CoA transferase
MRELLADTLVVSLEQAVAAPFCTSRLADSGAEVIKIERAAGDFARGYDHVARGESAYFVWLNRGKKSVVLDLKSDADMACLLRMLAEADVFVQNLSPGATDRLGIGSESLRARFPQLITCDISGFGETGEYARMKAYDLIVQAESGLAAVTGSPEGPGRVGVSVCDIACGMYAHTAILEALMWRRSSGEARSLKVSLFSAIAEWMTVPLLHHDYGGRAPERVGLRHPSIAPYGVYTSAGGAEVLVAIQNEREWQRFCRDVLLDADLADDERFSDNTRRCEHRSELEAAIGSVLGNLSAAEIRSRMLDANLAFGSVNSIEEFSQHPQLRRATVGSPSGDIDIVAPPVTFDGEPTELDAVPALGQHTEEMRRRFREG